MAGGFDKQVLILVLLAPVISCQGLLITNEDRPSLLDRVLQVVWEPSSLIRMWVGLDQLFNIARSWKGVAEKIVSLPFDKGRSMDHIMIKEPRMYPKPSVTAQWERFSKFYDSSNLSPVVKNAQETLNPESNNALESYLHPVVARAPRTFESYYMPHQLPPPFLFQPQEVFLGVDPLQFMNSPYEVKMPPGNKLPHGFVTQYHPSIGQDSVFLSKLMAANNEPKLKPSSPGGPKSNNNSVRRNAGVAKNNVKPQERLNMFLSLMKSIGDMHKRKMAKDNLENADFR